MRSGDRIAHIDILRGIGIIFMVLGHYGLGENFDIYIHAFHMPLFFWISGYLYSKKEESLWKVMRGKSRSLIVPYFVAGMINWSANVFLGGQKKAPLVRMLTDNTEYMPIAGALWFLTALFFTYFLWEILVRLIRNQYLFCGVIVIITITGMLWTRIVPFRLWWSMDVSFVGIGFFYVGTLFGNGEYEAKLIVPQIEKVRSIPIGIVLAVAIVNVFCSIYSDYVNMRSGTYGKNFVLVYMNAVIAIIVWLDISLWISKRNSRFIKLITNEIRKIGENSIVYVCFNQLCLIVSYIKLEQIFIKIGMETQRLLFGVSVIALSFIVLKIGALIVEYTGVGILFGKKNIHM